MNTRTRHRRLRVGIALIVMSVLVSVGLSGRPALAQGRAKVNGSGSQYAALAIQQWVAEGSTRGLEVNFLPIGSPQGMTAYGQSLVDFAATEAEFSALQATGGEGSRGYQYVPDVAGATAVLYNVEDKAGRKIDYLRLSPRTIARIFTGGISNWDDPAISADNKGLQLPDKPITVVYRSAQSGTTGTFYDFVANVAPDVFAPWAAKYNLPTHVRIIQLDSSPGFAPSTLALAGSDQIANYIANDSGKWSIGYDEFGYAKTYNATVARVQNASGEWVLPYAENITAALESAKLRPDLSQELSGVYASPNPLAYPISAYSYLVTQCAPAADRPTCKGNYSNPGVAKALSDWMRYIACDGQVNMAAIGYAPLPPNLSQELVNSIARMNGDPNPEQLTPANCSNPRYHGSVGGGGTAPPDPLDAVESLGGGPGGGGGSVGGEAAAGGGGGATAAAAGAAGDGGEQALEAVAGVAGVTKAVGGGSTNWRTAVPAAYIEPDPTIWTAWPLLLVLGLVAIPPSAIAVYSRIRRSSPGTTASS